MISFIEPDSIIKIPRNIATCPICGANLVAYFDSCEQDDDGLWKGTSAQIDAECEPTEIGSVEWEDYYSGHYSMPYVDWLPVQLIIDAWVAQNWRFNLDD